MFENYCENSLWFRKYAHSLFNAKMRRKKKWVCSFILPQTKQGLCFDVTMVHLFIQGWVMAGATVGETG